MQREKRVVGGLMMACALWGWDARAQEDARRAGPSYEAIVVGSGYGGSIAALALGRAGIETLVLERGRDWTVRDPTSNATFATLDTVTAPGGDGRSTWLNSKCIGNSYLALSGTTYACPVTTGILEEVDQSPETHRDASPALAVTGVRVTVAAGVGGGSLVNNGVTFAPTKAGWDAAFPASELPLMQRIWVELSSKYFARAERALAPAPTPPAVLATEYYRGTRLVSALALAAGYRQEDPNHPATLLFGQSNAPTTVDWDKVADEIAGRRVPAFILGETNWGNNSGAKRSLDKPEGYLGRAIATRHVTVKPLHTVTDVAYDRDRKLYAVSVVETDVDYRVIARRTLTTRQLFLAAGSLGTTKLLVRARDRGQLPKLNRHVGTRWSTNGDQGHFRFVSDSFLPQGGPAGNKLVDFRDAKNPVIIEQPPLRVPASFANNPQLNRFFGAVFTIGFGIPSATGNFRYDAAQDTVRLTWPPDGAKNVYDRVTSLLTDPALGGQPFILPIAQSQGATFHPLGGVPVGLATDAHCGLRGYRGLYAIDGSLVPGASAVANPALIIAALAERCMDHIVGHWQRELAEETLEDDAGDDE